MVPKATNGHIKVEKTFRNRGLATPYAGARPICDALDSVAHGQTSGRDGLAVHTVPDHRIGVAPDGCELVAGIGEGEP